ncbi:morphogenic membrane protein MmpB [Streptomyces sp. TR06-5]
MLWSDPEDRPPTELRAAQAMLRRLGWILAAAVVVVVTLVSRTA